MTHIPITSGERVEVLSLPEDHYARRLLADLDAAEAERDALKKDQSDWRKGVALIASYMGEKSPPDLCCVRIARKALDLRASSEKVTAERDALKAKLAAAEEERDTQATTLVEERDDAKAKLAALVKTATDLREVAFDGPSEPKGAGVHGGREGVFDWKQRIDRESAAAIAAARGGAS